MNIPNVESPAHVSLQVFKNNCGYAVTEHRYREEGYDSMSQFSFMSALFSWGVSQCSWKWRFWFLLSTSHILPQNQYYLLNDAKICPVCYLTSLNIVLIFFLLFKLHTLKSCTHKLVLILPPLPYVFHFVESISLTQIPRWWSKSYPTTPPDRFD